MEVFLAAKGTIDPIGLQSRAKPAGLADGLLACEASWEGMETLSGFPYRR